MKVSKLKIRPNNPRRISPAAMEKLKESITRDPEFMVLRPIVVDEDLICLGGNQRLTAIQQLGMKDIPDNWVIKASDLTEEQRKRFVLVDNSPAGMAGDWDYDILTAEWEIPELEDLGFDIKNFDIREDILNEEEKIKTQFLILITCIDENNQTEILERLLEEGIECKALVS